MQTDNIPRIAVTRNKLICWPKKKRKLHTEDALKLLVLEQTLKTMHYYFFSFLILPFCILASEIKVEKDLFSIIHLLF